MQLKVGRPIMKATTKELSVHSKELLDAVSRGKYVVIIIFRGKPYDRLVPYEKSDKLTIQDEKDILIKEFKPV
jgi:prevent-host-death family protein